MSRCTGAALLGAPRANFKGNEAWSWSLTLTARRHAPGPALPFAQTESNRKLAQSVVRNIAEGAGRWSKADSSNRYKIARAEAMECAASLDVLRIGKLISEEHYERGNQLLHSVVSMLTML